MLNHHPFRCVIIGEGSLPIQCAQLLLQGGHQILGIVSSDPLLEGFATEFDLPFSSLEDDFFTFLNGPSFDYLFSIVNRLILPEKVLNLPQRLAINYHDSPLPKYAGLYASSWALLHGEKQHAITWHVMKSGIDDGDILQQVAVEIDLHETALTLNAKCYEAAIAAFARLIDELATGTTAATPQDFSTRSYYSRSKKPAIGLQFHWHRTAQELDALLRALDFGPFPNPLRLPKLLIGKGELQDLVIASKLQVLDTQSDKPPGTITAIAPDALQVATTTVDVAVQRILNLQGKPVAIPEIVAQFGLQVGDQLPDLKSDLAHRIDTIDSGLAKHEPFWVRQLSQLKVVSLPDTLRINPPLRQKPAQEYATLQMPIPAAIRGAIAECHPDAHLADVVSAAFVAYLARISGLSTFDIGFRHPRLQTELAGLELFFAKQVACRIAIDLEQPFSLGLAAVSQQTQKVEKRKTYSSGLVARYPELASRTELQANCPFPIGIHQVNSESSLEVYPTTDEGQALSPHAGQRMLGRDLTLVIPTPVEAKGEGNPNGLADGGNCVWVYNTTVLDSERIASLANQFMAFLQALLTNPGLSLARIPLASFHAQRMTPAERHRILVEWNATATDYPQHLRLHDLFEAQVECAPGAIAVVFDGQSLTYAELNRRANQLAHHLQALGVKPEVSVGICIERSLEMVVGLLAILKAGGAYVPLDPTYPPDRLAHILSDAQLAVVLTQQRLQSLLPEQNVPTLCLDTHWDKITGESDENPTSPVTANNLAYIIYTSGSTGKPKGVLIEHQGAVNTILDINRRFGVDTHDRVLAVCSLNFDLSVYDIFGLLAAGGSIVLPKPAIAPDLTHWITLMTQEQVTLWNSAPPVMQMFAGHLVDYSRTLPTSLRLVLLSGDWIPTTLPALIRQLKQGNTPVEVISLGGATEVSIWSILYPIGAIDPTWKNIPYGKPMANQQFYILDEHQQPVPSGEVGELYIGGDGVARGYHNRPDLNATKFLPDPFRPSAGGRLYRTGDLGRYRPDGTIEFLGRIDHQVKIRGFRIEMGEIETVLAQHPAVRETAILAREDAAGAKQLVAYLVPDREQMDTSTWDSYTHLINDVRSFLKERLPDYMVPAAFVPLETLPLTPNGKLDRKALPEPDLTLNSTGNAHITPRDDIERQLAGIWQEFLDAPSISVQDNFFELGGHSLIAARMWPQVEKTFNQNLPLATLFQAPTIEQLANHLRQPGEAPLCPSLVEIQAGHPEAAKPPLFCIHTLGRGLQFCRPLVRYLDPQQPVYGLSTQIAGEKFGSNRAEDLAEHYIQQIRTIQSEGPYRLVGFSFGGIVAYEMARQLVDQGQDIALLALMDCRLPNAFQAQPKSEQFAKHWRQFSKLGPGYLFQKLQESLTGRISTLKIQLETWYFELDRKVCEWGKRLPSDNLQDYLFEKENTQSLKGYTPQSYSGSVMLFKAMQEDYGVGVSVDPMFGWQNFVQQVEVYEVSGTHLSMLEEPFVQELGEKLQESIARSIASGQQEKPAKQPAIVSA